MAKKLEFYEDAGERFEASMRKLFGPTPISKRPKKLPKADPKPVSESLDRA